MLGFLDTKSSEPLLGSNRRNTTRRRSLLTTATILLLGTSCIYLSRQLPAAEIQPLSLWGEGTVVQPGISLASLEHGLGQCQKNQRQPSPSKQSRHRNPRGTPGTLLIQNGHLWLGDRYQSGDIYVENGLITAIGNNLTIPRDTRRLDAGGRVVTPGIVDMHSHMTVDALDGLSASDDTNEMTSPATPFVRVIDALNPTDPGIKIVASGGITTSLILPGSGNVMGGEAAVIKLRPVPTLSSYDMLISSGVSEEEDEEFIWRYMKMACGENPKGFYGSLGKMPLTRLGEGFIARQLFQKAQQLKRKQDDWCDAAQKTQGVRLSESYPEDIRLESLTALLRHQVNLNIHCYLPQDFEAMIHHSLEFDFEIAAFHHALSAWQVTDILKRAKTNITVATFADMWGYKAEALNQNVHAPKILDKAGIPIAFKSDHPVMNSRDLVHEAQKAFHYGFDEHKALQALTSVPARSLKLSHRIGSIEIGKDADLVIWERHPLRLGSRPKHVVVDGAELDFKASWTQTWLEESRDISQASENPTQPEERHVLPPFSSRTMHLEDHGLDNPTKFSEACGPEVDSFVLRNISRIYVSANQTLDQQPKKELYMVVQRGKIVCLGSECDREQVEWPSSSPVFEMNGAVVLPGIISMGVPLGLYEIQSEANTQDGIAKHDLSDSSLHKKVTRAADGIKLNGLHLQKAYKAGVMTAVSQPTVGSSLLAGISTVFQTGVQTTLLDHALIKEEVALNFVLQHSGPHTVSQQIASIRQLLVANIKEDARKNVFARAAQGQFPVVIQVDDKDEIASIVSMKQYMIEKYASHVQFVILGGAESHWVASHLHRMDIPVILMPARCTPTTWQSRFCLAGPPLTSQTALDILLEHQVRVALGSTDIDNGDARNLIWEAGWNLAHNKDLSPQTAVGLVTWNIANILGLDQGVLVQGKQAEFIAYNSDPFQFGSKVLLVNGGGRSGPTCFPTQV
ncbi:hypothetical protein BY458DRAFT_517803 [Sporodiniella umbellata]|nr:hypothetical protein BY458DRAFT_517803 [Sporodiniella umbellata]